jgi:hypothetical protein
MRVLMHPGECCGVRAQAYKVKDDLVKKTEARLQLLEGQVRELLMLLRLLTMMVRMIRKKKRKNKKQKPGR